MTFPDALAALPHGPEFRFLDTIIELDRGVTIVAVFTPNVEAEYFRGHFPGYPIFPGVLMIEAIAQAAGVAAQSDPTRRALQNLRLTAVRQLKIQATEEAGATLRVEATIEARLGGLIQASGRVIGSDGRLLAEGTVTLAGEEETSRVTP